MNTILIEQGIAVKKLFQKKIDSKNYEKALEILASFFWKNPLQRQTVIDIYLSLCIEQGLPNVALEVARIYVEVVESIADIGRQKFGLPPLVESLWFLNLIGELVDQSAYVKLMLRLNKMQQKPVLCVHQASIVNKAFLPYLSDCFEIITDQRDGAYLWSLSDFHPVTTTFFKYTDTQYGYTNRFSEVSHADLQSAQLSPHAFELKSETQEVAQPYLKNFGLHPNDDFVVLHLREEGYSSTDESYHRFRNCNPHDYMAAIDWLLNSGLQVVRIGHPNMTPLPSRRGLIDLTKHDRPGEVDIYLCAAAKFYLGSSSGPMGISDHFGVPLAITASPYLVGRPKTFNQYLRLQNPKTQKVATFSEINEMGLKLNESSNVLQNLNLQPIFSGNEENLNFVKEMVEYLEKGAIHRANEARAFEKSVHGYKVGMCSRSLELL